MLINMITITINSALPHKRMLFPIRGFLYFIQSGAWRLHKFLKLAINSSNKWTMTVWLYGLYSIAAFPVRLVPFVEKTQSGSNNLLARFFYFIYVLSCLLHIILFRSHESLYFSCHFFRFSKISFNSYLIRNTFSILFNPCVNSIFIPNESKPYLSILFNSWS